MRNELFPLQHIQQYTDRTSRGDILRWIKSDRKTAVHIWHTFAGINQHLYTISLANFVFGKDLLFQVLCLLISDGFNK